MNYTEKHFSRCATNPAVKDFFTQYPDMLDISNNLKLIKYVICVYDPGSPFIIQFRDLMTRKQMAAQYAGYDIRTDETYLDDVYRLTNEEAKNVVKSFLKTKAFPREWMMIVANECTFMEYFERMIEPIARSTADNIVKETDEMSAIVKKEQLSKFMDLLSDRIEKGYRKMFGNDDAIELPGSVRTKVEDIAGRVG